MASKKQQNKKAKELKRQQKLKKKEQYEQGVKQAKQEANTVSTPPSNAVSQERDAKLKEINEKSNHVVSFIADRDGCGYFRCIWPSELLSTYKKITTTNLSSYIYDANFLLRAKTLRFQRQATNSHMAAWNKYLEIRKQSPYLNYKMQYEIDDLLMEIEPSNKIAYDFFDEKKKNNHLQMLRTADSITFSTEALKQRYVEKYGVDGDKIRVLRNTLPQFMFKMPARLEPRQFWVPELDSIGNPVKDEDGDIVWKYQMDGEGKPLLDGFGNEMKVSKKKPRIYWSGSASHLNCDLNIISELVHKTVDEYQWVFQGVIPDDLKPYVQQGKIEFIKWSTTYGLPTMQFYKAQPDICLAPLKPGIFNQCKSDLKYLEASALGAPCITSSFEGTEWKSPYEDIAEICIENDAEIWKAAIDHLLDNPDYYMEVVRAQYKTLNGRWMENYLDVWAQALLT